MHFPTWIDLKGRDSVPETVHHVVSVSVNRREGLVVFVVQYKEDLTKSVLVMHRLFMLIPVVTCYGRNLRGK